MSHVLPNVDTALRIHLSAAEQCLWRANILKTQNGQEQTEVHLSESDLLRELEFREDTADFAAKK